MTRLSLTVFTLTLFTWSCQGKRNNAQQPIANTLEYKGLQGTWIRHGKDGFTLIEIKDTSNILYYQLIDRKAEDDTIRTDRYWYYNSKAKLGYWDSSTIWIDTRKFRFDYRLKGDTLIEVDKMGDQGTFIKVYTDDEKELNGVQ